MIQPAPCATEICAPPVLALDVTALWDRPTTGIQRVIREVTPYLAKAAAARGWDVVLVRKASRSLETLTQWSGEYCPDRVHCDLDRVALGLRQGETSLYVQTRNYVRRTVRSWRETSWGRHSWQPWGRQIRQSIPTQVKLQVGQWLRPPGSRCTAADAYLTFAAGILPAQPPPCLPPHRAVFVLHDLIPLHYPQYCQPHVSRSFLHNLGDLVFLPSLPQARLVTASSHVAAEIATLFRTLARTEVNIDLVQWGYDRRKFFPQPDADFRRIHGIPDNALLVAAVSTQDPRKRFADIAAAVAQMNAYAVFLGQGEARREGNAIYLGYTSDEMVRRAYSTSDVFVNWSAAEGFGLPTIEALACGARVVVPPDNPTLMEVGGEHVLVAERADVAALCNALRLAALAPRPRLDLSRFCWEACAAALGELLWGDAEHTTRGIAADHPARSSNGICQTRHVEPIFQG